MNNRKKILFFGLGSIGKRHLRLLKKKFNYDIYAYRTNKENPIPDITNIYILKEAFQVKPDIVFITNPTYLHVETALLCLKEGIRNIFIEKPLSHSLNDLDLLLKEAEKMGAIIYIGYSMRHNPIIKRLKKIVEDKKKDIFYAQTICSSYLPNWRPNRDYRKCYSAYKERGGGVILELIHEFDYNEWFFGKIKSIKGIYGKISSLEIDSDDFCDVNLKFHNNINANIHLDYFSFYEQRSVKILTPTEEIFADLINKKIKIINDHNIEKEPFKFERDDYFEHQLNYFINGIENQSKAINNLKDAKELIEKLLIFKKKKYVN